MTTEQDDFDTPVVFRKDRKKDPEITAVFPCEPADVHGRTMSCYAHVGQHGGCSYIWYHTTRAAKPHEYADLLAELIELGYQPKVYRRITRQLRDAFNSEVDRLNRRTALRR
jgi:hypothetical protein